MPPLTAHAQTLLGTWTLTSYLAVARPHPTTTTSSSSSTNNPNGQVLYPLGPHPRGILIFTPNGFMSAHVMQPGAPPIDSPSPLTGPDDQLATAMRHNLAYAGFYSLEAVDCDEERFLLKEGGVVWEG
ncbi:hypothetical protein BO71DRAFT_485653 [Aspergillus ellipticus CBS 707.79]|uniref:Lipocalin-like domain-containing protein n=1 Tax=Aspergillus ellipticus CBS 707.79 TaxID=1448320 RepID=A0A319DD61_9EURO|nr:hypothetical protein BO71DRAFT_485653 [Aspergillus ellipticus CBS 707.79]